MSQILRGKSNQSDPSNRLNYELSKRKKKGSVLLEGLSGIAFIALLGALSVPHLPEITTFVASIPTILPSFLSGEVLVPGIMALFTVTVVGMVNGTPPSDDELSTPNDRGTPSHEPPNVPEKSMVGIIGTEFEVLRAINKFYKFATGMVVAESPTKWYVLTNRHVVNRIHESSMEVVIPQRKKIGNLVSKMPKIVKAKVEARHRFDDLALVSFLKSDIEGKVALNPVVFANNNILMQLQKGEKVVMGKFDITEGENLDDRITTSVTDIEGFVFAEGNTGMFIDQTMIPGHSGSGVFNEEGFLIGVIHGITDPNVLIAVKGRVIVDFLIENRVPFNQSPDPEKTDVESRDKSSKGNIGKKLSLFIPVLLIPLLGANWPASVAGPGFDLWAFWEGISFLPMLRILGPMTIFLSVGLILNQSSKALGGLTSQADLRSKPPVIPTPPSLGKDPNQRMIGEILGPVGSLGLGHVLEMSSQLRNHQAQFVVVDRSMGNQLEDLLKDLSGTKLTFLVVETNVLNTQLNRLIVERGQANVIVLNGKETRAFGFWGFSLRKFETHYQSHRHPLLTPVLNSQIPVTVVTSETGPRLRFRGLPDTSVFMNEETVYLWINEFLDVIKAAYPPKLRTIFNGIRKALIAT